MYSCQDRKTDCYQSQRVMLYSLREKMQAIEDKNLLFQRAGRKLNFTAALNIFLLFCGMGNRNVHQFKAGNRILPVSCSTTYMINVKRQWKRFYDCKSVNLHWSQFSTTRSCQKQQEKGDYSWHVSEKLHLKKEVSPSIQCCSWL